MSKNTLNGSKLKLVRKIGFLTKIRKKSGLKILKKRMSKGRWKLIN